MASLERRGRTWRVVWRIAGAKRHLDGLRTKAEAQAARARIEGELAAMRPVRAGAVLSWAELLARYCADRASRVTESHLDQVRRSISKVSAGWASVGDCRIATLPSCLTGYDRRCLRGLLAFARDLGQPVDAAVIRHLRPQPQRAAPRLLLTDDQVAWMQAEAGHWGPGDGGIVHMIATYGHRSESLIRLAKDAVDLAGARITLRVKSGDTISHPLIPATVERLRSMMAAHAGRHLFPAHLSGGDPWPSAKVFASWFCHHIGARIGKGAGILGLRRYAITRMLGLGLDARTIASITGHRTVSLLLNTYAQTNEQRQLAAVSALSAAADVPSGPHDAA